MSESDWLACNDSTTMLTEVGLDGGSRKIRLFVCACLRRLWDQLTDEKSRIQVEVAERFADGLASRAELVLARVTGQPPLPYLAAAAWYAAADPIDLPFRALHVLENIKAAFRRAERMVEVQAQTVLARDVFNLERPPRIEPAWLRWQDGTVAKLAASIYEARCFDDLPMLADALEEASCDNRSVLKHFREPGTHVRGCRVLDAILGKK